MTLSLSVCLILLGAMLLLVGCAYYFGTRFDKNRALLVRAYPFIKHCRDLYCNGRCDSCDFAGKAGPLVECFYHPRREKLESDIEAELR